MGEERIYAAIDLKSFYASCECIERELDPMTTNLLVADPERTEKTICLAVSPSLKAYGISGRARLFEVVQKLKQINEIRREKAPGKQFTGSSWNAKELDADHSLSIDYIIAPPRMAHYMEFSAKIYAIYLRYVAPEDIQVYSIDEVFLDVAPYLKAGGQSAYSFVRNIIQDVLDTTGITATAGIGTNLYLCKVAMDIVAKHVEPDKYGVRIAQLDEKSYRKLLWSHKPLTDFWRVGPGYAQKLEKAGLYTMGDIARCSLGKETDYYNEEFLYKMFGVNAQLLIDHAWGWEPCTIAHIKAYKPTTNSLCSGQVLQYPYTAQKAKLIVREMTDTLVLDLVEKRLVTNQMVLTVGYDVENIKDPGRAGKYKGRVIADRYGRKIPKHAHGTVNLTGGNSSTNRITAAMMDLYDRIVDPDLLVRRVTITANHITEEKLVAQNTDYDQLDMFSEADAQSRRYEKDDLELKREKCRQHTVLLIKKKYGKNAILKGMNLEEGATAAARNGQIGGHKA